MTHSDILRVCRTCERELSLVECFGRNKHDKLGHKTACKSCEREYRKEYYARPEVKAYHKAYRQDRPEQFRQYTHTRDQESKRAYQKSWCKANPEKTRAYSLQSTRVKAWATTLVARARASSKRRSLAFDLDSAFVLSLYERQDRRCHWLRLPLEPSIEKRNPLQPSLDRLDPSKGYTRDNVVLSCQFANLGRNDIGAERFSQFLSKHLLVDADALLAASVAA